jgi:hypothetical protein
MPEVDRGQPASSQPIPTGFVSGQPKVSRSESRKYPRFRIDEARIRLATKGFLTSLGIAKGNKARRAVNLSEGGVMLLLDEKITVDSKVTVRIEMERHADYIESAGQVRWCEQSARSAKDYYAGVEFTGLGPADLKKIGQMRDWFTSPEYKTRTITRRRLQAPEAPTDR